MLDCVQGSMVLHYMRSWTSVPVPLVALSIIPTTATVALHLSRIVGMRQGEQQ